MVRRYKNKSIVRQYDADNLARAVADVKTCTLSVRIAATMYSIPRSAIGNYVNGRSVPGTRRKMLLLVVLVLTARTF